MIEPTNEQWAMLSQALGDLLVELGVVRPAPMTGPELLMHAETLIQDLREGRLRNPLPTVWWCKQHHCVSTDGTFHGCIVTQNGTWDLKPCRIVPMGLVPRETSAV